MAQEKIKNKWLNGVQLDGLYTFDEAIEEVKNLECQRIPNDEDWEELFDNTKYSFDKKTKEGVFIFQDKTEIRFPAMGFMGASAGILHDQGALGYYWSSSVPLDSANASCAYFHSTGKLGMNVLSRTYDFSVRCVRCKEEKSKHMKRFIEKIKAIYHIIKGGQYAVFIVNNGYVDSKITPNKAACLISDNAEKFFLQSIVDFTKNYIVNNIS